MENFNYILDEDLEEINGGDAIDVALTIGGFFNPAIGALGAIKTCSDWLDSQDW